MLLFATRAATARARRGGRTRRGAAIAAVGATPREARHLRALEAWIGGDLGAAAAHWQAIFSELIRAISWR